MSDQATNTLQAPLETALADTQQKRPAFLARLLAQPSTVLALFWVLLLVVVAIFAQYVSPYDPNASSVMRRLQGLSQENLLGTDDLGRDLLSRAMWGARVALLAVTQAVLPAMLVGVPIGLFVAYRGGWWARVVMRVVEVEQAIPMLLFTLPAQESLPPGCYCLGTVERQAGLRLAGQDGTITTLHATGWQHF